MGVRELPFQPRADIDQYDFTWSIRQGLQAFFCRRGESAPARS